jgi:glycosyltransferase involved in cell wall biosynthesis
MVLSARIYPPDRRVEREALDLIRDGHNLFLMVRRNPGQPKEEVVNGIHVLRVPLPFQRIKMLADLIYEAFQRYFIFFHIIAACRNYKIDALHVHDLPYAFATTLAGKILRLPVIFDMHENYVVMRKTGIKAKGYRLLKPFLLVLMMLLRIEEKIACRWARKVIVVAQEHIPRIVALGVSRQDTLVVTNTEDIDYFTSIPIDKALIEKYRDDFVILYFGGLTTHRGLDTAIQAMPAVLEKIPNAKLLLVGRGYSQSALENLSRDMGLDSKVLFIGLQPPQILPTYIYLSNVGLIPHISTPHIETTMPNKIFQFMMFAKPVVVSSTKPMMRVVNDAQCGLIFTERDPESLADTIGKLADGDLASRLGENGRKAVIDRYNWQQTVQVLLELYRLMQATAEPGGKPKQ